MAHRSDKPLTGAEMDQAQMVKVRKVLHDADECIAYDTDRDVARVLAERDALRAALARYGRHLNLCSFYKDGPHQASPDTVCDCGLSAACQP